ncbi:MAG: hypothetical protein PHG79_11135 [Methanosarcina sp.]|nr:hypothetical protein [Methanosarcina sp.]MDD4523549.1 hypothetical protein [Methanosarcina sp.]
MAKINLTPYVIKVRRKRCSVDENLKDLFGTSISLFDIIQEITVNYQKKPFKMPESKKALKFEDKIKTSEENQVKILQNILYYGEYGILRKVMDTNTGVIDPKLIEADKSPVFDLTFTYFQDELILNQSYIIAQSYSNKGYKTVFKSLLESEIKIKFGEDITVEINSILSSGLANLIRKGGRIVDITFTAHKVSKDSTDILLDENSNNHIMVENAGSFSISLSSSRNKSLISASLDKAREFEDSLKKVVLNAKESPFFEVTKSELSEIKVKISTENKDFTVNISAEDSEFKEVLPFDDEDVILNNGTIAHNYILNEAKDYALSISERYRSI